MEVDIFWMSITAQLCALIAPTINCFNRLNINSHIFSPGDFWVYSLSAVFLSAAFPLMLLPCCPSIPYSPPCLLSRELGVIVEPQGGPLLEVSTTLYRFHGFRSLRKPAEKGVMTCSNWLRCPHSQRAPSAGAGHAISFVTYFKSRGNGHLLGSGPFSPRKEASRMAGPRRCGQSSLALGT